MIEGWRNAAVLGALAVLLMGLAQLPRAWRFLPLGAAVGVGVAAYLGALAPAWALDSLVADAPWLGTLALVIWTMHAESTWIRARSWPAAVGLGAVLGDRFVAAGLVLGEPDTGRRARLVLAASGASLMGFTSGAAPLLLGWGGLECVGIGLVLAAIGFVGGSAPALPVSRPPLRTLLTAGIVPMCGLFIVWFGMLGGGLEAVATGLERLPLEAYSHSHLLVFAGSILGGGIADEGILALCAREIQLRALSLRGDDAVMAIRAGLAVGGGLPSLVLTGSRLRVGLPLWLLQVGVVATWLFLR